MSSMSRVNAESLNSGLTRIQEFSVDPRRLPLSARLALYGEVIRTGFLELWAHKLRSTLTLTLLMLGVFALVVMTSVLDGVMDRIGTGFAGMSWDGTIMLAPKSPQTTEEQKRFAMSPGLRYEDLPRLTAPHPRVLAFLPRAQKRSAVRVPGGTERLWIVGVQAPGQIFSDENYYDANGILIPIEAFVDRIDPDHKLVHVAVKLKAKRDLNEVSAMMIGRAKQAHHNIEDIEITDLEAELARSYENFLNQMHGWTIVLMSLAATVLLVGGVGVLSVMLISFSDRRYEIGLRKAMGASDHEVFIQFLLEALVLAAVGALAGTVAGAALCQALSPKFPYGLVVNPVGLLIAWATALALALVFGMYPAIRASRLSPMEAMR